eukprot:TRINITY_DN6038_c0_g1_i1.p1 TRINITY_DN6038_c0_g1~~TRINITY_DN6038_c0_g1_i1.p1  ORF type:complete len:212 (+),score=53.18 TRINITY_DN6038_c0_g1_i1:339-974(+)
MNNFLLLTFLVLATGISAKYGFDASAGPFSVESMKCMKDNNYVFVIFRAHQQLGRVDPNAIANVKAALAGGLDVDVYIYPCPRCRDPKQQVIRTVQALKGLNYKTIWLDVERQGWNLRIKEENRKFLKEMFMEATKHGKKVGIYTSSAEWSQIVGNDWTEGAKFPLWWARWDAKPTLKNFQPFAGWRRCIMKQYDHNKNLCGVNFDQNYTE